MELTILYAFIRNQEKLIDIIAYPLIIGPTIALLFPLGSFHLGGFFTFYFVYYHVLLIVTGCYYLWTFRFQTTKKHVVSGALYIFFCDVIALFVNFMTGGNYMFIGEPVYVTPILYYGLLFLLVWLFLITFHFFVKGIGWFYEKGVAGRISEVKLED